MQEEIIASAGKSMNIPLHPEGQFAATCIDIVDLGDVEMTWQGQTKSRHRIYLRFYCGESFEDDDMKRRPLWIDSYFTLSLHEKGNLRPFLESWRGQKFTDGESGFNVANLLGVNGFIQVSHNATPDRTYANIDSIMRLPDHLDAPGTPEGYVRVKDRPPKDSRQAA